MTVSQHMSASRAPLAEADVSGIEALLKQQTETYRQVVAVMQEKRDAIIACDHQKLTQADQTLVTLGHRSLQLEKERLDRLAEMGLPESTLSQLLSVVRAQNAQTGKPLPVEPLTLARQQLNQVIEDVKRQNDQNRRLLDLSIQWIEKTVEVIARAIAPEGAAYNQQGNSYNAISRKKVKNPYASLPQSTVVRDI